MPSNLAAVRAEALFVSGLQSSQRPDADEVRQAVTVALARWGTSGCAAAVAAEFGDHPETAVTRMTWALAVVQAVYAGPARRTREPGRLALHPVALAS